MTVYLVGAGPGDPGLLTRRGAQLLAEADVVVHDRLVDRSLLALAKDGAELVDVGKRPTTPGRSDAPAAGGGAARSSGDRQSEINRLLVELGRSGRTVVRLKGGDPFVFGRGGEEVEALRAAGVPWVVVPGVSSALGVPAGAGIPLTHRGLSASVSVVTGHLGDPADPAGVDWASLAAAGGTLVVLMGMADRREIADRLIAGGRPAGTPVAVVEWGTTPAQRTVRTTLAGLAAVDLGSPSVIVVGPVAALDLAPVAALDLAPVAGPLAGATVVVTRPPDQAGALSAALADAGARVLELPTIEVAPPEDGGRGLAAAAAAAAGYTWVAFTSANAVGRFAACLRDGRDLGRARLAAVGPASAEALARHGLVADLVPARASADGLVAAIGEAPEGGTVLFPRAAAARETLPEGLRAAGWTVDEVVAYRTVEGVRPPAVVADEVARADAVVFTSPSGVRGFVASRDDHRRPLVLPAVVACIGEVTASAVRSVVGPGDGRRVVVASSPTPAAMVVAVAEGLDRGRADGAGGGVAAGGTGPAAP
ncbi:MAG: uroporphyrinogen-III C-methyltransferase [Acidimicrobiales bacterium]